MIESIRDVPVVIESVLHLYLPRFPDRTISDLYRTVIPCIRDGRFMCLHNDGQPVCFADWGFLSSEAETDYISGIEYLLPDNLTSGENLWIIDFVSEEGFEFPAIRALRKMFSELGFPKANFIRLSNSERRVGRIAGIA